MKSLIMKSLSGILLAALAAGGCTGGDRDYFPLTPGLKWTYETQTTETRVLPDILGDAGGREITTAIEIREVLPEETMDGHKVIPVKFIAKSKDDTLNTISFIYYYYDDNGIYGMARKTPSGEVKKLPRIYIMKFPLKDGLTWHDEGEDMPLNSKLEVLAEPVSTKAGSFKNCIKIHRVGANHLNSYEYIGYYTPYIGVIKYEVILMRKGVKRETKGELVNFSR